LLVREILDRPEDMQQRIRTYVSPWVKVIADLIRKGQRSAEVYHQVDPEAYVLQVINMVVCGVATASSLAGSLLPTDSPDGAPSERLVRELVRVARFSLFPPAAPAEPAIVAPAPHGREVSAPSHATEEREP
jgi:hypothetical protein